MKTKVSSRTVFIAIVAALGGILFGYDTAVISGTTEVVKMQFGLSTGGEGWYVGCALIGSILGVLIAGMMSDFLGRKKTMLISALLFSISAIGCAVSQDFTQLVIFRIVGGFGIGIVSIVSPVYISEVSPAEVRGTMVSLYQLFITIGFLLAYLANYLILKGTSMADYWRPMLGAEAVPDILFLVLIFFIPESPRWLAVRGEREDKSEEWKALREPGILKAVLIGSAIAILGQFMGVNAVLYYGPKIFADAGFEDPLFSTVLVGVVNMLTTVIALAIIDKVGRKQLVWWGVGGMIFCLLMIGLYFLPATSLPTVVFVLLSEMYPNRVRGLAMSIAGFALWIGTYLIGQLTPWMLETLTPAGTFFLFAFMCLPYLWIMYKHVPNTTGKTLEEIEEYWRGSNKQSIK